MELQHMQHSRRAASVMCHPSLRGHLEDFMGWRYKSGSFDARLLQASQFR